ncbi:MAG: DUF5107 domain-containing protein [Candidatus Hydrogenedentes bacterium]|nr:DUF5107 domain-containing protein [Candidatus Hydrogenedentota bacterium]
MGLARFLKTVVLVLALLGVANADAPGVKVWEDTISIPTYPIYADDVNPKFYELEGSIVYPYSMQDHLSTVKEERVYRALFLENEYLKVTCLPQIGGRIHSVLDKTRGEEMFHLNRVIKPGLIAMRGAWPSGGVEWNRGPQGHTVTSFSPVNVVPQVRPDGSASLVIGYTEHNFRTRWNVRLTLHPGKAYLDEEIRIYNPTDGTHSYYFWNNTAFPFVRGTRFIYPMTLGTDHGGTNFFSWPMHEGRDMTYLRNYDGPTSVFAYQCAFDFFGAYDVDRDRGIVQYGNHEIITGKKAWTWGGSGDGLASQAALTDEDGPYIEVQSGPLATQADYGLLGPHQDIAWREWWYPVHGLGDGFEYATRDVAIQTYRSGEGSAASVELRLLATGRFPDATCQVSRDGAPLLNKQLDLAPDKAEILIAAGAGTGPVNIAVVDSEGNTLAAYTSPLPIPQRTIPELPEKAEPQAAEEAFLKGVTSEEQIQRVETRKAYEQSLAMDPAFVPALRGLAGLDLEAGLYDAAAEHLEKALARNPRDGWSWYYLGVARLGQNRLDDAAHCGYRASAFLDRPALGYDLAGRAHMRLGKFGEAVAALEEAVRREPGDSRTVDHWLAALHATGQREAMLKETAELHAADPLDMVPAALVAMQDTNYLEEFVDDMKQTAGVYDFEMIELALFLNDLGLTKEALQLLDAAYETAVPAMDQVLYVRPPIDLRERPLPWYLMAWLAEQLGQSKEEARYRAKARAVQVDYAFPSHVEFVDVLGHAIAKDPADARAHLFLGNALAGLGRIDEAVAAWENAAALPDAPSVVYRNLGMHAWKSARDLSKASELYRKAIAVRPADQVLHKDLANILIEQQKQEEAIALLEGMPLETPRRGDVMVLLAGAYNGVKRYDDTLMLLDSGQFSNWENNSESWRVWSRAHLERGKLRLEAGAHAEALADFEAALTYPENLGVGRPARPEEAESLYWKGKALAALGKMDEARATWKLGGEGKEGSATQGEFVKKCQEAAAQ